MSLGITWKITDNDGKWRSIRKAVKDLDEKTVAVGIHSGKIALYAAVNEYGSEKQGIPSRPFMGSAFDNNLSKYQRMIEAGYNAVLSGESSVAGILTMIGLEARNDIVKTIHSGAWVPNRLSTIKGKRGSTRPLVDTGQMARSVTFVVGALRALLSEEGPAA